MSNSPHILMCPPDYYGIQYEINPWMSTERQADHETAVEQWNALEAIFGELNLRVSLMLPVEGLPDLVFTANAALIHRDQAIISRFRHTQRQGEEKHNQEWFANHKFQLQFPPKD